MGLRRPTPRRSFLRRYPILPLTVVMSFMVVAIFAEFVMPEDPYIQSLPNRLQPPFWVEGGSLGHALGTDTLGRDILSRMILGARASMIVAVAALLVGGVLGGWIGIISGYFGGRLDAVIMRVADGMLAFPVILIGLFLAVTIGAGYVTVVAAVALVVWSRFARVIRGEVLSMRERDFVKYARIGGCSHLRIMSVHIFLNVAPTLIVLLTLQIGSIMMLEASLSFLGAGIPPPTPTWGSMTADGRQYITTAWWISLLPGTAITVVVLSFNRVGDWLRDSLDPKLRQV